MVNIRKFINNHTALCYSTGGIAILGYLGYKLVRYIAKSCFHVKSSKTISPIVPKNPFDFSQAPNETHWWSSIKEESQFLEYKEQWKERAATEDTRSLESKRIFDVENLTEFTVETGTEFQKPIGRIGGTPGDKGMWIPGVALIASYLAEKKKINGLYVCGNLKALTEKIREINANPADQRCALIVASNPWGKEYERPQHKMTVCIEKKNNRLSIAILDCYPTKSCSKGFIDIEQLKDLSASDEHSPSQELIFRYIFRGLKDKTEVRLLHSEIRREFRYGCAVFAVQDAIAFLQDPDFFTHVECSPNVIRLNNHRKFEGITKLPPEFMVGTQSATTLKTYTGDAKKMLIGKKKSLSAYLVANSIPAYNREGELHPQNHYITKKHFKYLRLIVSSLKHLKADAIRSIINRTLITNSY